MAPSRKPRRRDALADARVKNRIANVLAAQRRRWPNPERVSIERRAAELAEEKNADYGPEAIRKILRGTYPAMVRLGIAGTPELAGIDTDGTKRLH